MKMIRSGDGFVWPDFSVLTGGDRSTLVGVEKSTLTGGGSLSTLNWDGKRYRIST